MAKQLLKGNYAIAEAALRAGVRFYAGYPITPQSEIPEYIAAHIWDLGGTFIQGESEVASINMVYGAACSGVRAMTSSSGLGMSLKAEGISYIAGAMLPALIMNVSRGGPGLGSIQPAQQDYLQATKAMGHGGFRNIVLAPYTVQEAVDLIYNCAFQLAERDRNPVVMLLDGCLGVGMEEVELPPYKELPEKRPDWALGNFNETGPHKSRIISSIFSEDLNEMLNKRAAGIYKQWEKNDVQVEEYMVDDAEYVIVAYGMTARIAKYCIGILREEGVKIGLIRPITLFPFPKESFNKLDYNRVKAILDLEMAIPAQMVDDIQLQVKERVPILTFGRSGGNTMKNEETLEAVRKLIGGVK